MPWGQLQSDAQSVELNSTLQPGLRAIAVLSAISFCSSTFLFLYLVHKLVLWRFAVIEEDVDTQHDDSASVQKGSDAAVLGIDEMFAQDGSHQKPKPQEWVSQQPHKITRKRRGPPNQFIVLICNLMLADMHQGLSFFLVTVWLRNNEIEVGTAACFAQGLFISVGDLASGMFITLIAIHTYISVVGQKKIPQRAVYLAILGVWLFVYGMATIPIGATHNGASQGGFFARAGAWCWINQGYEKLRLLTHYLFIFIALFTTSVLYILIFIDIRRKAHEHGGEDHLHLDHNPVFLLYPIIYVACTLPLALGRIATMAGAVVPLGYYCFAGAMISSNGSFDCLLFGTTRSVLIFGPSSLLDREDVGLGTFSFMRTPQGRRFGNMVWIQGGGRHRIKEESGSRGSSSWHRLKERSSKHGGSRASRTGSQESLRGQAVQMDTITSVVVELENHKGRDSSVS